VSLGLLLAILTWVEPGNVLERVRTFSFPWLAAALAASVLQFWLAAERWRRTARHLGVPLARRRALADYYLAGFGNQVLPGGVLGDAARAWRHSRTTGRTGPAVRAVVLERASGQLAVIATLVAILLLTDPGTALRSRLPAPAPAWVALGAALIALAAIAMGRIPGVLGALRRLGTDAQRALLARDAWPAQLLLSLGVLITCCAVFACAGRMIGAEMSSETLLLVAPAVLVAMLVPVSIGGWGVREVAAAGIWGALGWPPAEGVAVSIAYGLLCLIASLPGAAVAAAGAARVTAPAAPGQASVRR
jgi:uncharacterized membrane protein YbhN (UPF0104 family)